MRGSPIAGLLVALPWLAVAAGTEPTLRFLRAGAEPRVVSHARLGAACEARTIEVDDPYYAAPKRFRAWPLACVLAEGLGPLGADFAEQEVLLRALDGYTRATRGAVLLEPGGHLAFADADRPEGGFDPIDFRQVDPSPYFLVWQGAGEGNPVRYPWPYQLAEIELVRIEERFPHLVPTGAAPDSAARRGFAVFRESCLQCHAINGEGGRVGPELNVPRNILDYRPEAQLRAFVRDPQKFRYTQMPANPHLSDADLDALIAYLRHMAGLQHDPYPDAAH